MRVLLAALVDIFCINYYWIKFLHEEEPIQKAEDQQKDNE